MIASLYFILCLLSLFNYIKPYSDSFYSDDTADHEVRDELYGASFVADVSLVKFLLDLDPEILTSRPPVLVNRIERVHGRTSLMVCGYDPQHDETWKVDEDCYEIAKMMHLAGANLTIVDKHGWDALSHGSIRGMRRYCEYLLDQKVPIDRQDKQQRTALMKAAAHAQLDVAKLLLGRNANYRLKDERGLTALHYGAVLAINNSSYIQFFENLLQAHPNDAINNLADKDGRTVLMYAVISNNLPLTKLMLSYDADPTLTDNFSVSASSMSSLPVLQQLLLNASVAKVEKAHARWLQQSSWNEE